MTIDKPKKRSPFDKNYIMTKRADSTYHEKDGLYYKTLRVRHLYADNRRWFHEDTSIEEVNKDEYDNYQLGPNDNWLDSYGGGQSDN